MLLQAQGKDSAQDTVSGQQQQSPSLIRVLLEELEAMTCAESGNIIPLSLQPAVQHTLDCIRRYYQTPLKPPDEPNQVPSQADLPAGQDPASSSVPAGQEEEEQVALDDAWQYLAELLCEQDSWAAGVGQNWLYQLLTEAAEQHMAHFEHQSQHHLQSQSDQYSDDDDYPMSPGISRSVTKQQLGLLPHPLGGPPKPDAPSHLSNQPELAQLLRAVLSYHTDQVTTGTFFVAVVKRLVLHLKLRCSVMLHGQSQSQHDSEAVPEAAVGSALCSAAENATLTNAQQDAALPEDLLASTANPGMASMASAQSMPSAHSMPSEQGRSSFTGSVDPVLDPLAALHPHLMRTSPALNWGKPAQDSDSSAQYRLADSEDEQERMLSTDGSSDNVPAFSTGHNRTQSDPRGLLNSASSTADGGLSGLGTSAAEAKEDVGAGHRAGLGGADSRALSSILSTTELTGILQDGERQQGGIVLHDAPPLGHDTLNPPPKLPGTLQISLCPRCSACINRLLSGVGIGKNF